VLNSPGVEMPRLGSEWPVFERLCEHHRPTGIPDAWIAAAVPAHHAPGEFRQGIPPFPEGERTPFAAALKLMEQEIKWLASPSHLATSVACNPSPSSFVTTMRESPHHM
jgi:hypothetical protein